MGWVLQFSKAVHDKAGNTSGDGNRMNVHPEASMICAAFSKEHAKSRTMHYLSLVMQDEVILGR
jgi:hypothetical protein